MTILVINPNSSTSMTRQLESECRQLVGIHHPLKFMECSGSPASIEGFSDGTSAAHFLLETMKVMEAETEDSKPSAYVIACFDDTGLDAARELTTAPVLGIGEAAMHAASLLCQQFCIMTTLDRSIPILTRNLNHYGLSHRCAGVFASHIPVLLLESDPNSYAMVLDAARKALLASQGEALVLGCAGMSRWVGQLEHDLGMPVLDGVRIAVHFAQALVDLRLTTSKVRSYQFPEKKIY